MDPAGRAWRLKGQSPFTGSRAKGALLSVKKSRPLGWPSIFVFLGGERVTVCRASRQTVRVLITFCFAFTATSFFAGAEKRKQKLRFSALSAPESSGQEPVAAFAARQDVRLRRTQSAYASPLQTGSRPRLSNVSRASEIRSSRSIRPISGSSFSKALPKANARQIVYYEHQPWISGLEADREGAAAPVTRKEGLARVGSWPAGKGLYFCSDGADPSGSDSCR